MSESAASISDQIEEAYDAALQPVEEAPVDPPETPPETPPEEEPQEIAAEAEEEAEEELLEPQEHWGNEYKETFRTMNRAQQDRWLEREKMFEDKQRERSEEYGRVNTELENSKAAISQFQNMISPLVSDWERQGLAPSQGLMRLVALEKDLRDNPATAVIRMAEQYGVNLEQEIANQPYIDPQTREMQRRVREQEEALETMKRQQTQAREQEQQRVQENAFRQLQAFAGTTDESGAPKYPYVNDPMVQTYMSDALAGGQANSLADAYEQAIGKMREHPFYRDQVQQSTQSTQKKVQRAKEASKVVRGDAPEPITPTNEDAAILKMLEDAGLE